MADGAATAPLLAVEDLSVSFATEDGRLRVLDGVSFTIPAQQTVAVVGESGSGKTVTAHSILRILPTPPARIDGGRIAFEGHDLLTVSERAMRSIRGARIAIVFQDPGAALDPVQAVGVQVMEAIAIHQSMRRRQRREKALELLTAVGFADAEARFGDYPHQLSGGMKQRVMIAMALACEPALLIADEPTTALDSLGATRVADLLDELKRSRKTSLLLISHDISLVADHADHLVVLYAGQVVEQGPANQVLAEPRHPYTQGLLASIPPLLRRRRRREHSNLRLRTLEGEPVDLRHLPVGCRFAPRCPKRFDRCDAAVPPLYDVGEAGMTARCFLFAPDPAQPSVPEASDERG